jgi:HK97 family phage major capsid protein
MDEKQFNDLVEKVGLEAAKKIKAEVEALKTELNGLIAEAQKDRATKAEFDSLMAKFDEAQETILKHAVEIEKYKNTVETKDAGKSFTTQLKEKLVSLKDDMVGLKTKQGGFLNMAVKVAGTMTTGNILPSVATAAPYMLTESESGITRVVRRQPFLRQLVSTRGISTMYASWAEQVNPDGGAGTTAEGADKTQADFDVQEATKKVEKLTSFIKTSKENLDDVEAMMNEIETELLELVELKLDSQLLSGDDATPNLKGILEYATDFTVAGTVLANAVERANRFDALRVAAWQVTNAEMQPNFFLINGIDATLMDLTKTSDGFYVLPPFTTADGRRVASMIGVENNGVTAGDFLVGDFSKSNLRIRQEIEFSMGYINDDWKKGLINIGAEMRATHYIKSHHTPAFVKGTFSTAIAAIEKAANP